MAKLMFLKCVVVASFASLSLFGMDNANVVIVKPIGGHFSPRDEIEGKILIRYYKSFDIEYDGKSALIGVERYASRQKNSIGEVLNENDMPYFFPTKELHDGYCFTVLIKKDGQQQQAQFKLQQAYVDSASRQALIYQEHHMLLAYSEKLGPSAKKNVLNVDERLKQVIETYKKVFFVERIGDSFTATEKSKKDKENPLFFKKDDKVVYVKLTKVAPVNSKELEISTHYLFPYSFFTNNSPVTLDNNKYFLMFAPKVPQQDILNTDGKVVKATVTVKACAFSAMVSFNEVANWPDCSGLQQALDKYGFASFNKGEPLIGVTVESEDGLIKDLTFFPADILFKSEGQVFAVKGDEGVVYHFTVKFASSKTIGQHSELLQNFRQRNPTSLLPEENITSSARRSFFGLSRNSFFVAVAGMVMFGTTIFALLKTNTIVWQEFLKNVLLTVRYNPAGN